MLLSLLIVSPTTPVDRLAADWRAERAWPTSRTTSNAALSSQGCSCP